MSLLIGKWRGTVGLVIFNSADLKRSFAILLALKFTGFESFLSLMCSQLLFVTNFCGEG